MNLLSEGPLTENETLELENIIYELIGEDGQLGDPYTLTTVDSAILLLKLEDFFYGANNLRLVVKIDQFSALSMLYGFICSFLDRNHKRVHLSEEPDDESTILHFENLEWSLNIEKRLKELEHSPVKNAIIAIPKNSTFKARKNWWVITANPIFELSDSQWVERCVRRLNKWRSRLRGFRVVSCKNIDEFHLLKQWAKDNNGIILSYGTKPQNILNQALHYDDFFLIDCFTINRSREEISKYINDVELYAGGILQSQYLVFADRL